MKFFGKFEKDNDGKVYRTKTFICLNGKSSIQEPDASLIIGTIFMLNPGSSRPLYSDVYNPFEDYIFDNYTELETDVTMSILSDTINRLQGEKKYLNGIIEVKNLFNYREDTLSGDDWLFLTNSIQNNNILIIDKFPVFNGKFVLFAWGTSKLRNKETKEYARSILTKCKEDSCNVLYISPKTELDTEKYMSFYHPLGGYWNTDKRQRFNDGLYQVFSSLKPIENFS